MNYTHTIKEIIKDHVAHLKFIQDGKAYYEVVVDMGTSYEFPIPINDMGTGIFNRDDKAILFMRWIRKAMVEETMRQLRPLLL